MRSQVVHLKERLCLFFVDLEFKRAGMAEQCVMEEYTVLGKLGFNSRKKDF